MVGVARRHLKSFRAQARPHSTAGYQCLIRAGQVIASGRRGWARVRHPNQGRGGITGDAGIAVGTAELCQFVNPANKPIAQISTKRAAAAVITPQNIGRLLPSGNGTRSSTNRYHRNSQRVNWISFPGIIRPIPPGCVKGTEPCPFIHGNC